KYATAAFELYKQLIRPFEEKLHRHLIIVPDGTLGYLPFGALLRERPRRAGNYRNYVYLERAYTISYDYSASLFGNRRTEARSKFRDKLLAVALDFSSGSAAQSENESANRSGDRLPSLKQLTAMRSGLDPLYFTVPEAREIAAKFDGDLLINEEATFDRFAERADDYDILHLSTHAIANDEAGDFSFLAFSSSEGNRYDSLFAKDIYNLRLSAEMVVLSACETGAGEMQRGEGIISLARAFSYAGARSIVTTLWSVNDRQTREIMLRFYENLKDGRSKDKALQQAKLAYIEEVARDHDEAHPIYWAAFSPIGDMRPLSFSFLSSDRMLMGLAGAAVLLGLFWLGFRQVRG
ncbi:MAG: CHAT domain-containing protein, partial [Saprospiraceae bacterium]|nr:CHAT domain-containing protein [Saprospiraceae bacterium]